MTLKEAIKENIYLDDITCYLKDELKLSIFNIANKRPILYTDSQSAI